MKSLVILLLALLSARLALGQISVEVQLDQEQFLPNESLIAKVRITNLSGHSVKLGVKPDWLLFSIEDGQGRLVPELETPRVVYPFTSESGTTVTRRVDVAPYYDLSKSGRYKMTATVNIPDWGQTFSSPRKAFEVSNGAKLWETLFGVPGKSNPPETRRYVLVRSVTLNKMRLYLRLTNKEETQNYRVFPLGTMVSFTNPEAQLDSESNLHVLHQTGAHSYNYAVVNPDGVLVVRQTYEIAGSRPALKPGSGGKIGVAGGARKYSQLDVPAPKKEGGSEDAKSPLE